VEVLRAAQMHELRQGGKWYRLVEMVFDIYNGDPLLPWRKSTLDSGLNTGRPAIETCKLMYEEGTDGFKIGLIS